MTVYVGIQIAYYSELHEIMVLNHFRHADDDSELCFDAHMTPSPLSRYNGISTQITDNSG